MSSKSSFYAETGISPQLIASWQQFVDQAQTSAAAALVSQNAAAVSQASTSSSASSASTSAANSASSAAAAAASQTAAATSATGASTSASTATTQASTATTQATNSASSASAASTSATNAANSATAASGSASAAATSATNAANSATAAATSASTLNIPAPGTSNGSQEHIRVNAAKTGYELRTPTQVKADLVIAYTDVSGISTVGHTGAYADLTGKPTGTQAQVDAFTASIVPTADQLSNRLAHGQCRLVFTDATHITLKPFNGNKVFIPSSGLFAVPSAGIACAVGTALVEGGTPAANTTYYAYLSAASGGTLSLSATTHAADAATGVEIRSADNTRILVGMVRVNGSTQFADAGAQRFVASYFNRAIKSSGNGLSANQTTASTSYVELSSAARAEFVTWGDEANTVISSGNVLGGSGNPLHSVGFDGVTAEDTFNLTASGSNSPIAVGLARSGLAEGYHYATMLGAVTTGTAATWTGFAGTTNRCSIYVGVRG